MWKPGDFELKLQNSPKLLHTNTLDFTFMQMSKFNSKKAYSEFHLEKCACQNTVVREIWNVERNDFWRYLVCSWISTRVDKENSRGVKIRQAKIYAAVFK